jgi:hypothetical protein
MQARNPQRRSCLLDSSQIATQSALILEPGSDDATNIKEIAPSAAGTVLAYQRSRERFWRFEFDRLRCLLQDGI